MTESKDRTEPTDKIVEYGPTIADQTLTSTTTNPVPFNTTFVADPNLPAGEQVVDKQGEAGALEGGVVGARGIDDVAASGGGEVDRFGVEGGVGDGDDDR